MTMKNTLLGSFLLAMFLSLSFSTLTFAQTSDSVQIQNLLAQIKALQAQLDVLQKKPSNNTCVTLSHNLYSDKTDNETNGEVTKLQRFLAQDSSVYPSALITGYFGPATEKAVQLWQTRNGIVSSGSPDSTGYGYVGPSTRAAMVCRGSVDSTISNTPTTPYVAQADIVYPVVKVSASPLSIEAGQSTVLSWNTTNAKRCVLQYDSIEENVSLNGSKIVSPSSTTLYKIWCVNDSGTGKDGSSSEKIVKITLLNPSPSCTLTANKSLYEHGETIKFSWTSKNADYTMFWQDDSGKDHLKLPGDKNSKKGSVKVVADVLGSPYAKLLVYNNDGRSSSCRATVSVD